MDFLETGKSSPISLIFFNVSIIRKNAFFSKKIVKGLCVFVCSRVVMVVVDDGKFSKEILFITFLGKNLRGP